MKNRLPDVNYRNINRNWVEQRGKTFSAKNRGEGTEKVRRYDARHVIARLQFIIRKKKKTAMEEI
jgi:hypothetical protein